MELGFQNAALGYQHAFLQFNGSIFFSCLHFIEYPYILKMQENKNPMISRSGTEWALLFYQGINFNLPPNPIFTSGCLVKIHFGPMLLAAKWDQAEEGKLRARGATTTSS